MADAPIAIHGKNREKPELRGFNSCLLYIAEPFGSAQDVGERTMLKGGLLWLIGIPIPIILGLWAFGVLG